LAAPARLDALVLDLDTRAGLCATRQLGRGGYRLAVAAREPGASGLATRYALSRTVLPDPAVDFGEHVAALMALLREQPADVAIPSIDSSLEALQRNRDAIGRLTAPALGSPEAVDVALSKERTLEVARELGLATPRSLLVSSPDELEAAVAEMGMPCVLKPVTSWRPLGIGGERLSPEIVADGADVRRLGAAMAREDAPVLVQELAPGERETIKLFRHQGRVLARLAIVIDRTWPPLGGSSVMRRTTVPSETLDLAEKLVAAIGLDGYSEVEFRRDARGRPLVMEVNPRLSQSLELATRAGVDFPRMQLEWARGGSIPTPPAPVIGLRVGWLAGDLRLLVGALAGSPPPRPRFGPVLAGIASDYLLHRARLEGFDLRDRRPVTGAVRFALGGLLGAARR
jgi:biotin carboxylase